MILSCREPYELEHGLIFIDKLRKLHIAHSARNKIDIPVHQWKVEIAQDYIVVIHHDSARKNLKKLFVVFLI